MTDIEIIKEALIETVECLYKYAKGPSCLDELGAINNGNKALAALDRVERNFVPDLSCIIDDAADALRKHEQKGKQLNKWEQLPNSTKRKWTDKIRVVINALAKIEGEKK